MTPAEAYLLRLYPSNMAQTLSKFMTWEARAYVQRIDRVPVQMTTNRKQALLMGKFTAEDTIKAIQNSQCVPELVSVQVNA